MLFIGLAEGDASPLWRLAPPAPVVEAPVGPASVGVTRVIAVMVLTLPLGRVVVLSTVDVKGGTDEDDDVVVTNEEEGAEAEVGVELGVVKADDEEVEAVKDVVVDDVVVKTGVVEEVVCSICDEEVVGWTEVVGGEEEVVAVVDPVDVSCVVPVEPCTLVLVETAVVVVTGTLLCVVPVMFDLLTKVNSRLARGASS